MTTLVLLATLFVQDDPAKKLEDFKAAMKEAGDDETKQAAALNQLRNLKHDSIRDEAAKWAGKGKGPVRQAACDVLGAFKGDKKAFDAIHAALKSERTVDAKAELVGPLAQTVDGDLVKQFIPFLKDKEPSIAGKAVSFAATIRSKDLIDPLIDIVAELEDVKDNFTMAGESVAGAELKTKSPAQKRKDACLEPARSALKSLTGESCDKASEWRAWWNKNKKDFTVPNK